MTQPALFDHVPPPASLPVQGRTPDARVSGEIAAVHAATRRVSLAHRYLDLLVRLGAHGATDHEAAAALRCPVSSICSTRAGLTVRDQIAPHGHRRGPFGDPNTVYVLRIVLDQPLTPREVA